MDTTPNMPKQRVQLDLDFDLYIWVTKEVERTGSSRNELIRKAIRAYKDLTENKEGED